MDCSSPRLLALSVGLKLKIICWLCCSPFWQFYCHTRQDDRLFFLLGFNHSTDARIGIPILWHLYVGCD